MKRLVRNVNAASRINANSGGLYFTPTEIAYMLSQIPEFKPYNIEVRENSNGIMEFAVGDSVYEILGESR